MKTLLAAVILVGMSLTVAAADDQTTPTQQYREHRQAYFAASGEFNKAKTDQQPKTAVERLAEFPQKFVDLASDRSGFDNAVTARTSAHDTEY